VGKRKKQKARERELRVEKMDDFVALLSFGVRGIKYDSYSHGKRNNNTFAGGGIGRQVYVTWKHGSYMLKRYTTLPMGVSQPQFIRCDSIEKAVGRTRRWLLQGLC
jgi:hypothetical protein